MPQTPPPYVDITGISRADMKDNAQETLAQYDGNARPGELVVDLTTYQLYIGNADGNLNAVTGGGGGNGTPGAPNASVQYNNNGSFAGNAAFTFNPATATLSIPNLVATGNLLPSADNVYSLGSSTRQWKDMYVSANTIYLNNIPLSGNAQTLSYNSKPIVLASNTAPPSSANIATTAAVVAGNLVLSNATPGGGIVFPDGSVQTTAAVTNNYGNSNVTAYLTTATIATSGNVGGAYILGNGAFLTGLPVTYGNANVSNYLASGTDTANIITTGNVSAGNVLATSVRVTSANASTALVGNTSIYNGTVATLTPTMYIDPLADGSPLTGTVVVLGDMSVTGNLTYNQIAVASTNDLVWGAANNASNAAQASGGGLTVGPILAPYATWLYNATTNEWNSNIGANVAGNMSAVRYFGDGSQLTGITQYSNAAVSSYLASGTDTANIVTSGNISGGFILGNGAFLTGLPASYYDANVSTYLASGNNTANIITTANVAGNYFVGNGRFLTGMPQTYTDANVSTYLASGADTAGYSTTGNITTSSDVNAVRVNAGDVSATGNVTADGYLLGDITQATGYGNIAGINLNGNSSQYLSGNGAWQTVATGTNYANSNVNAFLSSGLMMGNVITAGNVFGDYFIGNGSQIKGLPATYTDANVVSLLSSYGSNTISTTGNVATGSLTAGAVTATSLNISTITTLSNIGNVHISGGSAGQAIVTDGAGNLTFTNIITQIPPVYFAAPITGNNQSFSNVVLGQYTNVNQITVFYNGALLENTYYSLTGDTLTVDTPLNTGDTVDVMAGVTAGAVNNITSGYGNSNVVTLLSAAAIGDVVPAGNGTDNLGSIAHKWNNVQVANAVNTSTMVATGNVTVGGALNVSGNATIQGNLTYNDVSTITTSNLIIGLANNQSGFAVNGGGMVVGNTAEAEWLYNEPTQSWDSNIGISAAGNIAAPYFIGDGSQLTGLPAGYTDGDVSTYLASGNNTAGYDTTGNVTAAYFVGDGSQLTGLPASYGNADVATYLASNANVTITTTGSFTSTANVTTTGNVAGAYIKGNISQATGLGNVSTINKNGDLNSYLNGSGTWTTPSTTTSKRDITKISQMGLSNMLILADNRLFCIKDSSGNYSSFVSALGEAGIQNDILRGIDNCYEIVFPSEDVGIIVDADIFANSAYALMSNGNLYTWGENTYGQLGLGDTTNRYLPMLSAVNVSQVYISPSQCGINVGYSRLVMQKTDGTIWACGYNGQGEMGVGTNTNYPNWTQLTWAGTTPMSVWNLGTYKGNIIVQKSDGTIWISGDNASGQMGRGNTTSTTSAVQVAAWLGGDSTMIVQKVLYGGPYSDSGGTWYYTNIMMLLDNGTTSRLVGSGSNNWGSLGTGNLTNATSPVSPIMTSMTGRIIDIMGPGNAPMTMFALQSDGDLYSWGYNTYGSVGNGTTTNVTTPYRVLTGVLSLYGNIQGLPYNGYVTQAPVVYKANGLYTWGYGGNGQIGDGDGGNPNIPVQIRLPKDLVPKYVGTVTCNSEGTSRVLVTYDNNLWVWGYNASNFIDVLGTTAYFLPINFKPAALNR